MKFKDIVFGLHLSSQLLIREDNIRSFNANDTNSRVFERPDATQIGFDYLFEVKKRYIKLKTYLEFLQAYSLDDSVKTQDLNDLLETKEDIFVSDKDVLSVQKSASELLLENLQLEVVVKYYEESIKLKIQNRKRHIYLILEDIVKSISANPTLRDRDCIELIYYEYFDTPKVTPIRFEYTPYVSTPSIETNEDPFELSSKVLESVNNFKKSNPSINFREATQIIACIPGIRVNFNGIQGDHGGVYRDSGTQNDPRIDTIDEGAYKQGGMRLSDYIQRRTQLSRRVSMEVNERKQRITQKEMNYALAKHLKLI